jgi:hypothetical protein
MSKKSKAEENVVQNQIEFPKDSSGRRIEAERFCPVCWGRFKGYGTSTTSTFMGKRYYKCDKVLPGSEFGPCGFSWPMEWEEILAARARFIQEMQAVVVQHRPASVNSLR